MSTRWLVFAALGGLLSCGDVPSGTRNSAFGSPNGATFLDTTAGISGCPCVRGFCCGTLCCDTTQVCCVLRSGEPVCASADVTTCDEINATPLTPPVRPVP